MVAGISFGIEVHRENATRVVVPFGELDIASASELEGELDQAWQVSDALVVVDLRRVEFIDSAGLRVIANAHQRAVQTHGHLVVVEGNEQVQRMLSLTGLMDILTIVKAP